MTNIKITIGGYTYEEVTGSADIVSWVVNATGTPSVDRPAARIYPDIIIAKRLLSTSRAPMSSPEPSWRIFVNDVPDTIDIGGVYWLKRKISLSHPSNQPAQKPSKTTAAEAFTVHPISNDRYEAPRPKQTTCFCQI